MNVAAAPGAAGRTDETCGWFMVSDLGFRVYPSTIIHISVPVKGFRVIQKPASKFQYPVYGLMGPISSSPGLGPRFSRPDISETGMTPSASAAAP